ncbi:MAG: hypothetical protein RIT02_2025 [Planctomycetota bacterium]|jgi:hypothetical protein
MAACSARSSERPHEVELNVDVVRERAEELRLCCGDRVSVRPKTARIFMPEPEYVI